MYSVDGEKSLPDLGIDFDVCFLTLPESHGAHSVENVLESHVKMVAVPRRWLRASAREPGTEPATPASCIMPFSAQSLVKLAWVRGGCVEQSRFFLVRISCFWILPLTFEGRKSCIDRQLLEFCGSVALPPYTAVTKSSAEVA